MAKRKPKEVERRALGLYVGNGNAGPHVVQYYEIRYDNGTSKIERGHAVFAMAGMSDLNPWMVTKSQKQLQKKLYRPDLYTILKMVHVPWERLSSACLDADTHKDNNDARKDVEGGTVRRRSNTGRRSNRNRR